jgi:hypothetical protein
MTIKNIDAKTLKNWLDNDQAIFFSYKTELEAGALIKISGTVKAHRDNVTQLNRVKIL